jgi:hypothetical protein
MSRLSRIRLIWLSWVVLVVLRADFSASATQKSPTDLSSEKPATKKLLHRSRINAAMLSKLQLAADADKTAALADKDHTANLRQLKLRDRGVDKLNAHALSRKQQLPAQSGQPVSRKMVGGPLRSLLPKLHSTALLSRQAALTKESVESPRASFTHLGSLESLEKLTSRAHEVRLAAMNKAPHASAKRVADASLDLQKLEKLAAITRQRKQQLLITKQTTIPRLITTPLRQDLLLTKLGRAADETRAQASVKDPVPFPVAKSLATHQGDEDDSGPLAIGLDQPKSGVLSPAGDVDKYSFSGIAGDQVDIVLNSPDFDAFLELELDGDLIAADDDSGPEFNSFIQGFVLPADGTYVIVVRSLGDTGVGSYDVSLLPALVSDFRGQIDAPSIVTDVLAVGETGHLYQFDLAESSNVTIDVTSNEFDTFAELFAGTDPSDRILDNSIAFDDDGGIGLNSLIDVFLSQSSYLIEVRSFSGGVSGTYTLEIDLQPAADDEDAAGPISIFPGDEFDGFLDPEGDIDEFVFFASTGEVFDLGLESADFDAFLEVEINGEIIAVDDDSGEGFNSLLQGFVLPLDGEYIVRVIAVGSNLSGSYRLSFNPSTPAIDIAGSLDPGVREAALTAESSFHIYNLAIGGTTSVTLELSSDEFDTFIALFAGSGVQDLTPLNRLSEDDDGGDGTNSRLEIVLGPGEYLVEVGSFDGSGTGVYSLDVVLDTVGGADEDEFGPQPLAFDVDNIGSLSPEGDVDEYLIFGAAGETIEINLGSADFDTFLEVERNGTLLAADDDSGEGFNSQLAGFVLPDNGEYVIRVRSVGDASAGEYFVSVRREGEGEDNFVVRGALVPGEVQDALSPDAPVHLYNLNVDTFSSVDISLDSDAFDTHLALFAAGTAPQDRNPDTVLIVNDDGGDGTNSRLTTLLGPGSYLLEVRPFAPGQTGEYVLNLGINDAGDDEDSLGPVSLAFDAPFFGALSPEGDEDVFSFDGAAGDAVDISAGSVDFDMFLELEQNGQLIAVDDDGGIGLNSLLQSFVLPVSGEYLIRVRALGDFGSGSYSIDIKSSTAAFAFQGVLEEGTTASTLAQGETFHHYDLSIASVSEVQIDMVSNAFDPFLALFSGGGIEDVNEANLIAVDDDGAGSLNARLQVLLDPGTYLVEGRSFSLSGTGDYTVTLTVTPVGDDEDAGGATLIAYGDEIGGGLFPEGDVDSFQFSGSAGDVIDISLVSADFDPLLELESGGQLIGVDDNGGTDNSARLDDYVLPTTGDYTIRAVAVGTRLTGDFNLTLTRATEAFAFQGQITPGTLNGQLEAGASVQLYTFTLDQFSEIQLDLISTDFDPFLVLYIGDSLDDRSADTRIAVDDDGGEGLNASLPLVLPPDSYLAEVRSFVPNSTGAFELRFSVLTIEGDEDLDGPVALEPSSPQDGDLQQEGDADEYIFLADAGDVVEIGLESSDFDTFLELEHNGELIAVDDDGGEGFNSLLAGLVLPFGGEYIVRVRALGDNSVGVYSVSLLDVTPDLDAKDLLEPGTIQDVIATGGEVHLFPFELTSFSEVDIRLTSDEFDAFLILFSGDSAEDRSEENVVGVDDDGGGGLNSRLTLLLPAGLYLIEAGPLTNTGAGEYTLDLEVTPVEGDEDDPNPVPLAFGQELEGRISPVGDVDLYTFSATAGDEVEIELTSPEFDTFLELSLSGETLAANDDGGDDLNSKLSGFVLPTAGSYQIRVRALGTDASGLYTVSLNSTAPPLVLQDPVSTGSIFEEIRETGQVHLYPLLLDVRSSVQIELTSDAFDGSLSLYVGEGVGDRRLENRRAREDATGETNAQIVQELAPGTYLIEAGPSASGPKGAYVLDIKIEPIATARDRVTLTGASINSVRVNPVDPVATVSPDEKITGTIDISVFNAHARDQIFPVGATPTWGIAADSYWEVEDWAPPGDTTYSVAVDLVAPSTAGTYHLILAAAAELTVADIMSGTHWESQASEIWNDDDDLANLNTTQITHAEENGWVGVQWFDDYEADIGAAILTVEVVEAQVLPPGPVSLDLDPDDGDQGMRQRENVTPGDVISVQLVVTGAPEMSGWEVLIEFDDDKLTYVEGSFVAGSFIPGLVALAAPRDDTVNIGGTVLAVRNTNSGDGVLGTLSFEVQDGFSGNAELVISQIGFRTVDSGRIKQDVRSAAELIAGFSVEQGPLVPDFDLSDGNQDLRRFNNAEVGQIVPLQLYAGDAPEIRGWSARLDYDDELLRYVSGSFVPSDFISGLAALVGEKPDRLDIAATVLGQDKSGSGAAVLGTLSFEILEAFTDSAHVTISQVGFNTLDRGEVVESSHVTASIYSTDVSPNLVGDFNRDSVVDALDFFLFADNFGRTRADADWDATYDLSGNGEIDFSDFFILGNQFGLEAQAKILAMARDMIGLPLKAHLQPNYPNPFNTSTTIPFVLLEPGQVVLEIYDVTGQLVRSFELNHQRDGSYRVVWDGADDQDRRVSSGAYFSRLRVGNEDEFSKMLFLK